MNINLLYEDNDWLTNTPYFDSAGIIKDLGLKTLFTAAAKEVVYEKERVKCVKTEDTFIYETMKKVMMIPLTSKKEILYRQEVLKDCIDNEAFVRELYKLSTDFLTEWRKLGRGIKDKTARRSPVAALVNDVKVLFLFSRGLKATKELLAKNMDSLHSDAFISLYNRLCREYSDETDEHIHAILSDISFYTEGLDLETEGRSTVIKPKIVMNCGLENGLKLSSVKLMELSSERKRFHKPGGTISKLQEMKYSRIPDSFSTSKLPPIKDQSNHLEFEVVSYCVLSLAPFMSAFNNFFDHLRQQTAFYVGAINIMHQIKRFSLNSCFPTVCENENLSFTELKELIMCMEQRVDAIGNTCDLQQKMLLIVTGANQGGKSTFLRSIGIAQVMMQSGLMVAADRYQSGIFPRLFTHFTRREDSEMNSGRLDEELCRMNQIVENIGENSLILLNESFATTTEKEGSVIAYDIIKALNEVHVKILTVTHLLSFAQRMYQENADMPESDVQFLCAERKENGERTYKMIPHAPQLTSFGLDLFTEIVGDYT